MVTGRPSITSSVALMSRLTNGNSSSSAARRSVSVPAMIILRSRNSGSSEPSP